MRLDDETGHAIGPAKTQGQAARIRRIPACHFFQEAVHRLFMVR